jgi:hypothetical protein
MFVPFFAVPLAASWIAAADGTPKLDVTQSCRGAAAAGYVDQTTERLKSCLDSEQRTRELLDKSWTTFSAADRVYCLGSIKGYAPTYTELATCLEMRRDVQRLRETPAGPARPRPSR